MSQQQYKHGDIVRVKITGFDDFMEFVRYHAHNPKLVIVRRICGDWCGSRLATVSLDCVSSC